MFPPKKFGMVGVVTVLLPVGGPMGRKFGSVTTRRGVGTVSSPAGGPVAKRCMFVFIRTVFARTKR